MPAPTQAKTPHICIIGAGVAGLRCADVLLRSKCGSVTGSGRGSDDEDGSGEGKKEENEERERGLKLTVLEGRDRVGGRLCQSASLDGTLVDVGPNWIHGTAENPILDLARETGTKLHHWDERQAVFDSRGDAVSPDEAEWCNVVLWGMIAEAFQYSSDRRDTDEIPAERSLFEYFESRVDAALEAIGVGDEGDEEEEQEQDSTGIDRRDEISCKPRDLELSETRKRRRELVLQMAHLWGAFVGTSVEQQSLRFFWLEKSLEGEDAFVAETFEKILARIAEPLISRADSMTNVALEYSTVVTAIQSVVEGDGRTRVMLKVANSDVMREFDGVIVTTPLGWLKRNKEAFSPALPESLSLAVDSISYGKLDKVYIKFPKAWWNDKTPSEGTDGDASADPETSEIASVTIEDDIDEQQEGFPGFMYWAAANAPGSKDWKNASSQTCINMAALPDKCSHPTLLFYVYGPASDHVAWLVQQDLSRSSSQTSGKTPVTSSMVDLFKPYYSKLPNYNPSDSSCTPSAILPTCWASDELAGHGSYSNFQVGLEHGDRDVERLREGMPERRIWFAGEHTAPFIATGTVTGAYWSGEIVAAKVMEAFELDGGAKI